MASGRKQDGLHIAPSLALRTVLDTDRRARRVTIEATGGEACWATSHNRAFQLTCRIILETDAAAIAGRVTRPRPDTTDIVINEQTLLNAYSTFKERVSARIQQL